jgi:iron complex outermembrane receptor protein
MIKSSKQSIAFSLLRRRGLRLSLALAMAAAMPGFAQTQTASTTAPVAVEEVVVTGSRIPQPNLTSTSPIQVTTAEEIRQQGFTDMGELLNRLPQISFNAGNDFSSTSNPLATGGGLATADLRGLGPQRTLVLVDGRRLGPGDPNTANPNPGADLNQIPVALVERVEVVTGGASAVYGSDAIAGVVNFIMKKNFEGIQIDGQLGVDQHDNHNTAMQGLANAAGFAPNTSNVHDGQSKDFSLIAGTKIADGKGNITAYLEYRHALPVLGSSRDFTACQLVSGASQGLPNSCSGSSNSNAFTVNGHSYSVVGNQLLPFPQAGSSPPAIFNSNPFLSLAHEDERYNAGFMAHVDVSNAVKPYFNFSFMEDKSSQDVAPSGLFKSGNTATGSITGVGGQYLVNCNNPLLSAQEQSVLCTPAQIAAAAANPGGNAANPLATSAVVDIGRRNIEGGPRSSFFDHTNYRAVAGATGEIGQGWTYDAYGQYYYTSLFNSNTGYLDYSKINNALQVTGTAANPVCVSGGSCVPYNIWTTGGVTPNQVSYLSSPGTAFGSVTERIIHGDVTGDLGQYGVQSPLARNGAGVNFGYEHRSDSLAWDPDAAELAGNLAGFSGAVVPIHNSYSVSEGFIEARAPIAQDQTGVKDLSLDAGYRYSKYSTAAGAANSYKFEVQYAPVDDVRLRGSFERAIRAPNIIELFVPPNYSQSPFVGTDPCAGPNPTASLAACMHTGVTAAQYGNIPQCVAVQCGQILGGNTALKPETADTYTVGLTFTPTFLRGFSGSVDFYNIDLKNQISQVPQNYVLSQCLATGDPTFCNDIVRNHATGGLSGATLASGGYIIATNQNIAKVVVRGIDVQSSYRYALPTGWGALSTTFSGTYLLNNLTTPAPGQHAFDCAGLFGPSCNNTVNPKWRHNMRVSWETPVKVVFSAQWRFIGKVGLDNNDPDPSLFGATAGVFDRANAQLPNMSYIDLSAIYNIYEGISIRAGVNNVFDKDPPIIATDYSGGAGTPNTFPTYDLLGRQAFLGFTAKF